MFYISRMKFNGPVNGNKNRNTFGHKIGIGLLIFVALFLGWLVLRQTPNFAENSKAEKEVSEHQEKRFEEKLDASAASTRESRNAFTMRIVSNPQAIDWTGDFLFSKILQFLENPQMNVLQLFDERISQLEGEAYYAGSYHLKENVFCELLWISNNEQLSLGFKLSGPTQSIKHLERSIENRLQKPSTEEQQDKHSKKGWYDKVYNKMKYDIEYSHDELQAGQSTFIMNIHPHVNH